MMTSDTESLLAAARAWREEQEAEAIARRERLKRRREQYRARRNKLYWEQVAAIASDGKSLEINR